MTQRTPCPEPERIPADPEVALAAWRWPSSRVPGVYYHVALLAPSEDHQPGAPGHWDCSCPGFTYRDQCQHVEAARVLLVCELRREVRQEQIDARLGCRHPLTVDEHDACGPTWVRRCVGCGVSYDRGPVLAGLERDIRERHRLPSSPWTPAERSTDCD